MRKSIHGAANGKKELSGPGEKKELRA